MSALSSIKELKARKGELLELARRSRAKWVMEAAKEDEALRLKLQSLQSSGRDKDKEREAVTDSIPGLSCIQTTLDFLANLSNDEEFLDVKAIVLGLPDDEEDSDSESEVGEGEEDADEESDEEDDKKEENGAERGEEEELKETPKEPLSLQQKDKKRMLEKESRREKRRKGKLQAASDDLKTLYVNTKYR